MNTQSSTIGVRLKQERERLGLSQTAFGKMAGVEYNAQGQYEADTRMANAIYFSSIAEVGVDVLFVLTGSRSPMRIDSLNTLEMNLLLGFRALEHQGQDTIQRLTTKIAELTVKQTQNRLRVQNSPELGKASTQG